MEGADTEGLYEEADNALAGGDRLDGAKSPDVS
jgi:hypothetical protein